MNLTKEQAIEQIHGMALAIENNDKKALLKLLSIIWPNDNSHSAAYFRYYFALRNNKNAWDCNHMNPLSKSIPATELLRILEGEWMPEVGEEYEFANEKTFSDAEKGVLLAVVNHKNYKFVFESEEDKDNLSGSKFCRPIQKKQITIAELFEKANLDINQYEVVK